MPLIGSEASCGLGFPRTARRDNKDNTYVTGLERFRVTLVCTSLKARQHLLILRQSLEYNMTLTLRKQTQTFPTLIVILRTLTLRYFQKVQDAGFSSKTTYGVMHK